MQNQYFHQFSDIQTKEIAPGYFSKLIHTKDNTINFIEVKAGISLPMHQHFHEQYSFVLEGKFELTINGTPQVLDSGMFAIIPSNIVHGGTAVTDCRLIDIFSPAREDYKLL
jgi:quercetin dioxygenase-like cupin family protein